MIPTGHINSGIKKVRFVSLKRVQVMLSVWQLYLKLFNLKSKIPNACSVGLCKNKFFQPKLGEQKLFEHTRNLFEIEIYKKVSFKM